MGLGGGSNNTMWPNSRRRMKQCGKYLLRELVDEAVKTKIKVGAAILYQHLTSKSIENTAIKFVLLYHYC